MTSTLDLSDKRKLLLEKMLRKKGMEAASRPAIPRRAGSGPAPLSFGQQRLWFLHQLEPAGTAYNLAEAVRLRGGLDASALQSALTEAARRHEVLRTVYAMVDGEPRQIVQPPAPVPLPRLHLAGLPAPRREAEATRIAEALLRKPFDLAHGPVLRAVLMELEKDDHVLVLLLHHIATDGWSMGLLVRELTVLYAALQKGAPAPLPELPLQYSDFAAWQRAWLQGETLEGQLRYWRERLAGAPTRLALPVDRPWPAIQSSHGDRTSLAVDGETAAALRELAREQGATLFMVLAGGLAAFLARITGEDDLLLGTPASGRVRPELEGLIGFFINTLVLRADLTGNPDVPALLSRVKETVLGADDHQDLPFERLIDALEVPRDLSRSPLFQVMLAFQNLPPVEERPGTLAVLPFPLAPHQAQFEMHISLADTTNGLFGLLEYRTELFDAGTAHRLARCFEALLAGMARAPRSAVADLPLLSPAEELQLVHSWNDTAVAYAWPRERGGLHHLVEAQAARTPGADAASFEGESLTYAELDARANRLARHLRALGAGPDTRVGVAMERSLELLVALLGILKSGAAYVPFDPDYPRERLELMLADVRPAVLLTQERLRAGLPETTAPVLVLHPDGRESADRAGAGLEETAEDLQLAYIIYTSGSTGRPKGAMVHHAGIRNRLLWMQEAYNLGPGDTVLQKTPYSFDVSVWEFFWPLLAGARVAFARPGEHRDPAALAARIEAEGVTVLHFVPSMLQAFLEEPESAGCRSLRRVVASGEALTPELVRRFHERLPGVALENLYGPTEAAVDVTFHPCLPDGDGHTVPIGRPIANTSIHLVDRGGRPVPLGVAGELWIGGVNVGRGYLDRPDLTAERFVPDPFAAPQEGTRAYRTGDLARRRPDGAIEYLGRIDHQVKLRGVRIELGEIESALLRHPGVREAAVVLREDRGVRRLVGYVAPAAAAPLDELRRFLLERLPEAMVPTRFVGLDALPLSPNGKLDRRALPAPDSAAALPDAEHVPPASPLEEILAEAWEEILDVSPVGARDNFFALGGDSILSLRVVARLRERGFALTLQQIFQHQTVRDLARVIAAAQGDTAPPRTGPFELVSAEDRGHLPDGLEDAYPLARLQAGMLFHSAFDPEGSVYHDIFSERMRGPFDEAALRGCIARALARHPVLRTSFALDGFREPLQLVHRAAAVPLEVEDLRPLPAEQREREVSAWLEAERRRGFDWSRPPLLRFQVHRLEDDTFQHSLSFHHAILDGWSAATLRTELMRDYVSTLRGEELAESLPESLPDNGFRDFIALERQALESPVTQEMWLRHLEGATATLLPRWPRPPVESPRGHDLFVQIPPERVERLRQAAREAGVPIKSLLCAAHLKVAQRVTGEDDVILGTVTNGRPEQEGADRSLGLFLNTLPFRMRLGEESWAGLAQAAFALERDLLPHRRFPLMEIQAAHGGRPLFEMVFGVVQFHVYKEIRGLDDLQTLSSSGYEETNFPLGVNFALDTEGSQLAIRLNYSDAELAAEQVQAIGSSLERALAAIADDPRRPHAEADLLSEAERRQLCAGWSQGAPAAPRRHAATLFEERVRQSPGALAVVADGARLTYTELDRRANQVARTLRERGVGPESRVAVCLDRSPDLVVALLAIWKAGGAYVPLDPSYPLERLRLMLEDSGAALLVTEEGQVAGLREHLEGLPVLLLDADAQLFAAQSDAALEEPRDAESLAYVIYTSGSTGRPKGVLVPHGGLGNLAAAQIGVFDVRPGDRVLQFSPVSFDASVSEVLMALLGGAELHLAGAPRLMPGPDLLELLTERRVTHLTLPPSVLAAVPEAPLPDLRVLVVAGEACPPELVRRWSGGPAGRRVVDAYGPTESTVCATAGVVEPGEDRPPVGRPIAGLRVLVLDRTLAPAPTGAPGEILLGGAGLARGYHGRPEITAERFVPDPFAAGAPGERLYRTGDLGRWLPDGTLDFLGRIDQQVKIRGFRIEPGEVAAALERHPAVRNAVAAPWNAGGDLRLAAWVVPGDDAADKAALPGQLGAFLRTSLPAHMIPSALVVIESLPLTPNGKLDRSRLPSPDSVLASRDDRYVAPRTATEQQLAAIWADVLGVPRVGVDDSFLELGGHSLLAMQLILRVRSELEVDLPLRVLYGTNTLADMALAVANAQAQSLDAALLAELLDEVEQTSPDQLAAEIADE